MRQYRMLVIAVAAVLVAAPAGVAADKDEFVKLFNGKDFSGWKRFLNPKTKGADPDKIWTIKEETIICEGSVNGYMITEKEYEDYVLQVEWRWPKDKKAGNSGVFVHVSGEDKIWPKGVEAQLQSGHAGDFWLVDGFKLEIDKKRQDPDPKRARHYFRMKDDVEKPLGEWNLYEITCKGDTVKLVINGTLVNEGSGAESKKGKILLQSEGAEVHFRNVKLKSLK